MRYEDWIRYEQHRVAARRATHGLRMTMLRLSQPPRRPRRPLLLRRKLGQATSR